VRLARRIVHAVLAGLEAGRLELQESFRGGERLAFGPEEAPRRARITLHDPDVYPRLVRGRSVALGETYAEGLWEADDLLSLLRIAARDLSRADPLRRRVAPLIAPFQRLASLPALNTRRGARRNIASHYDLGNELFETFLDREVMMYSSARFEDPGQTLEEAQLGRVEMICDALELGPDDHLLEIGTGWGGLAVHAASTRGCEVTTTTISHQQRELASARAREAGLEDRVRVIGADYRDLRGRYDKLVSIEMIEAVGWEWFDTYFRACSELLVPEGLLFLQAIAIDDRAYETEKRSRSFSNELIFPGGCLPSLSSITSSIRRVTDLRLMLAEDISSSYARTLAEWRSRFDAARRRVVDLGFDERFRRLWRFYFTISEAGFREGRLRDLQLLFAKPGYRGGPARRIERAAAELDQPAPEST
jgi:cyclopropane-fatty-acyl-phospholipid synthase